MSTVYEKAVWTRKFFKAKSFRWWGICCGFSGGLWVLSLLAIGLHPVKSLRDSTLFLIWYNIVETIQRYQIGVVCAVGAAILSGVILIINGEKRHIVLQLTTLCRRIHVFALLLFLMAPLLTALYASSVSCVSGTMLSTLSLCVTIFYILLYFIRFNNDISYNHSEICYAILCSYEKGKKRQRKPTECKRGIKAIYSKVKNTRLYQNYDNKKKRSFEIYVNLLYPCVPCDENTMVNDINILRYLLVHIKVNGNNQDTDYAPYIEEFFLSIVLPVVARIRRTYQHVPSEFVVELLNTLSGIKSNNVIFNIALQYLLFAVAQEYRIEVFHKKRNLHCANEVDNSIDMWMQENIRLFDELYGNVIYTFSGISRNFIQGKNKENKTIEKCIYTTYLMNLQKLSMINLPMYVLLERDFIQYSAIIKARFQKLPCGYIRILEYTTKELLLLNP